MIALLYLAVAYATLRVAGGIACGKATDVWKWHRQFRRSTDEPVYMDRWQLLRSPWLDVYVNRINRPDFDDLPHNHPWRRAWSFKLWGSYVERLGRHGALLRQPARWSRIPEVHRIESLVGGRACWTLFLGRERRSSWGFIKADGSVIPHKARAATRQTR